MRRDRPLKARTLGRSMGPSMGHLPWGMKVLSDFGVDKLNFKLEESGVLRTTPPGPDPISK
jgi:hypothetical protein